MATYATATMLDTGFGLPEFSTPMLNGQGGAFGLSPNTSLYLGWKRRIRQNGWCFVLSEPKLFNDMPNPSLMITLLKEFFETRPREWSGLQAGLSVDFADTAVGGNEKLYDPINVTRQEPSFQLTIDDIDGRVFQKFLEIWITYGSMDPVTKVSRMLQLSTYSGAAFTLDYTHATLLFFEPRADMRSIENAVILRGVFPESNGDYEIKRTPTDSLEASELSISLKGTADWGEGAKVLAQSFLNQMSMIGANFALNPTTYTGQSANLNAADGGLMANVNNAAATNIRG